MRQKHQDLEPSNRNHCHNRRLARWEFPLFTHSLEVKKPTQSPAWIDAFCIIRLFFNWVRKIVNSDLHYKTIKTEIECWGAFFFFFSFVWLAYLRSDSNQKSEAKASRGICAHSPLRSHCWSFFFREWCHTLMGPRKTRARESARTAQQSWLRTEITDFVLTIKTLKAT